jgi:hypothetical protein
MQNIATDRLLGRDTVASGDPEELTVGGGIEFTGTGGIQRSALSGDVTATAGSNSTTIANNAVTDVKLRDSAALSVIGRASNTTGDPADIVSATPGEVLQRTVSNTLVFDVIYTDSLRDGAVTLSKMGDIATDRIIGRDTAGTGVPESLTVGGGVEFTGAGGIQRSALTGDVTSSAGSNTTTIPNDTVTYAKIQNVTATDRLLGRDTAGVGDIEELTVGGGLEFTGTGGIQRSALSGDVVAAAGSNSTTIANNAVTDAKLRDSAALSVIGRGSNTTGDPADIVAANAGEVLQRSGTTLIFDFVNTVSIRDAAVTLAKMDNLATDRIIGRDTVGTGVPESLTVTGGLEFTGTGGIQRSALSGDVTATAGSNSTTIANNAVTTVKIADDQVTFAKMQNIATDRLLGRDTAASGDPEELTVGGGVEFTGTGGIQRSALTGDVTATAGSNSTTIANNAVTDAKIRDSAALSVIGRASNTTGDPADIVAANASEVLQRSVSNTLIFGPVDTGSLRDGSVTLDKMDSITTDSLLGRDTVGTGTPEVISVGGGIEFTGAGGIRRSALTGDVTATAGSNSTTIANNAVTYAKMQDVTAASRVLGKGTSGAGDPEELSLGSGLAMDTTTLDTLAMVISKHVISSNLTIPDGYSAVVSRYVEIAANITLTIGSDSDLEIL